MQQYGFWALSNLALANEDIAAKLKTNGIIEVSSFWMNIVNNFSDF